MSARWDAAQPVGAEDTRRAAELLAARLPSQLATFAHLAYDFACFWRPEGRQLFSEIDRHAWERCERNPVRMLEECHPAQLVRAAQDHELLARAEALWRSLQEHRARPFASAGRLSATAPVAFLCAEFGIYQSLPIYSGGLGALAGDLLKEASDGCFPMVGVGLYYRQGYFHQRLDASVWQHEYWLETAPHRVPIALVTDDWGIPITVRLRLRGEDVVLQIWRAAIGRTSLYLLDADRPENSQITRWLTARLYDSNREVRLGQYALLGIGGIRALRALGIEAPVVHLNEGHAALAAFELAREAVEAGTDPDAALDAARERLVFTTHTPVPAGNETYTADELWWLLGELPEELGLDPEEILGRGRIRPADREEPLGLTVLALRTSRSANGVSRVHGGVARGMWRGVWPERAVEEVPIRHITNGVHLPTWMAAPMRSLMDRYLGEGWTERAEDPQTWEPVDEIPDAELWAVRNRMRRLCVEYVRERVVADFLGRAVPLGSIESWTEPLSPDILTVGFARRLAAYKRLHLLPHGDPTRFRGLLLGDPPTQWLGAGKAHPLDDEAKSLLQHTDAVLGGDDAVRRRVAYVEDYDLAVATRLVAGCDLWVTLPRPPLEASGTSGMKAMLNGALSLGVLDGWWAEAWDGSNGWAIPADPAESEAARDDRDRHLVLDLFEREILPLFHDRDADGVPRGWMRMVKRSLRTNGPRFCTARMLRDYAAEVYAKG
ncbi:MAG: alpha-glucan family phosphorylase [Myxococcota bacterium]|nr:alpha-glucan family phosphorylase [Myxococcota bacterium]